jgi:hypothetical protein
LLLWGAILFLPFSSLVRAEALLQIFNVSYTDLTQKMPELAEAGYTSLWLPPPTKGSGGLSVGYDLWDPFDLGSKNQRDSISTRYGTEAELLQLMEVAHRFGLRVYFDNIMNHRAFDVPGYNENTSIETYPGMVPEDFHLRKTEDGFYRKWDNTRDWNSAWQVQNLGLADLIDIAHETPNANFGTTEGSTHPKLSFIRDLARPEQYDKDKNGNTAYFGVLIDQARAELLAGGTSNPTADQCKIKAQEYLNLLANKAAFTEDVGDYLIRAVRYKMDRLKADGLRLDAVKHVPDYFFGQRSGADKDASNDGYLGGIQSQFNRTRGFTDANHRDSVFDEKRPRDDAMVFGEHLGQPPGYGGYWDAGMRLVDNDLRSKLNNTLGYPGSEVTGLGKSGAGGFTSSLGVTHANSHDSDYAAQKEWQHAFYMTREGMGLIYSDGYNQAETLGESGGAFPRHANTKYLGQFSDPRIPNILKLHNDFARGLQSSLWGDLEKEYDYVAFERRDNRNPDGSTRSGNASDEITMVMMMNDNTAQGQMRGITTSFPGNAYLYQYAEGPNGSNMSGFYKSASELNTVIVPPGGYFLFSYRTPEVSTLWPSAAITLYQNGSEVPRITVARKDGRDGDASFNPEGLTNRGYPAGTSPVPYTYQTTVPVVKAGQPFTIIAQADGSAQNILVKLDGGVDLNGTGLGSDPAKRDNPPGLRTDTFLGYEQPTFVDRQHPEKFAAEDTTRCQTGSPGAETYSKIIGSTTTINNGPINANVPENNESDNTALWVQHSPGADVGGVTTPPKQLDESGADIVIWAKSNSVGGGFKAFVYYTLDGSFPEGAGGIGRGTTRVAELGFKHNQITDDWWGSVNIPKPPVGTTFSYKIGFFKNEDADGAPSWWPGSESAVTYKKKMLTTFRVADFNPATVQHFPHNDYARTPTLGQSYENWPFAMQTGLSEGFHVLRARAFLKRDGQAPLYNTFTQTFYYDAETPQGDLAFPTNNGDTVGGSSYEMVVRTDTTVQEVWYSISDSDNENDDTTTRMQNGNGAGFEPFVDANADKVWNTGETFTDLNGNGIYDTTLNPTWAKATEVTPSPSVTSSQPREWRFTYNNIPLTGAGTIKIRLLEASSSRNFTLDPTVAHVREITREVLTRGKAQRLIIAFPTNDGDSVDDNYSMQIYFPKSLSDISISESQMIARFTFLAQGNAQLRTGWSIDYGNFGPGDAFHQLSIPLPNLYNSSVNLQEFRVIYKDPADLETSENWLTSSRFVNVRPSNKPFIRITRPTEVGSDGKPTEIILPNLGGPEPFVDTNDNSVWDNGEAFTDKNGNKVWDGPDQLDYVVQVETSTGVSSAPTLTGITVSSPTAVVNGNIKTWSYTWSITAPGNYTLEAEALLLIGTTPTKTSGTARVILRQVVDPSGLDDKDDDHDGLVNIDETNRKALPTGNPETWENGDVHIYYATGKSLPTSPDSDGDGLPDGLELGWRTAGTNTDTTIDTNGDGFKNFIGDMDPPLYAVVDNYPEIPGVGSQSIGDNRTRQAAGSLTDPANPDTDGDGLLDGVEDTNRNGWSDGDGKSLPLDATIAQYLTARPEIGDWPNNIVDFWERNLWQETSATKSDSDDDGLTDGYGEDKNLNGRTDLFLKDSDGSTKLLLLNLDVDTELAVAGSAFRTGGATSRAINYVTLLAAYSTTVTGGSAQTDGWPKLLITETDPQQGDTDGDGLPDGWEVNNGLDPLDNGIYNFATGTLGDPKSGAAGDPDTDLISNADELSAGTHPNQPNSSGGVGPGEGTIRIGEFTDWTHQDLLALDEYNEGGSQGADVYRTNTSDNSRDIVAFSFRDGGATDGKLYFRVDLMDLAPNAWQGEVDAYIVIDTGNPAVGERAIPNEVDIATDMRWEVVVAAYGQDLGAIFVDTNRSNNSTGQYEDPLGFGVVSRAFGSGQNRIAWSSRYDAVEISVDRQNLIDAGWGGNPETLNFQVFTTRPNTIGSGTGDLSGRNDIRDTISDDWVASDYSKDQDNIRLNGKLSSYFGRSSANDRNKSSKVMLLAHGNQAIQPAGSTQALLHDQAASNPAGYHRLLATHENYDAPLTLHVTPTLASALEWAKSSDSRTDGPVFNQRIRTGINQGWINLLGSTFSDHMLKYFTFDFNQSNKALADRFLDTIYGGGLPTASREIFWAPERVLDSSTLSQIDSMGYQYIFADQMRHFVKWFGRPSALGTDGFRINQVGNVKIFPIHDFTSEYLDQTLDEGSSLPVRQLLSRRSRSNTQDQVVVLYRDLNDFSSSTRATSYDANIRWLASRPWIRVVTAGQIANGQISHLKNGSLTNTWGTVIRTNTSLTTVAKDWVDHASGENYDNWYQGGNNRPGLATQKFGTSTDFGRVDSPGTLAGDAWSAAQTVVASTQPSLRTVADSVLHGSMFLTAFHTTSNNDLSTFSTGEYIAPDSGVGQALAPFARHSQSQARYAKLYERVNTWALEADETTLGSEAADVDLDGANEYLLFNSRLFGVFETKGGRLTAAWMRNPTSGKVWQVAGNFAAYSNTDTEDEGSDNATAYRTSGFKDWWLRSTGGSDRHSVNSNYQTQATEIGKGWRFSNQNDVTKTITLASANAKAFTAEYQLSSLNKAYIRFGLSPNLEDLLLRGQAGLESEIVSSDKRRVSVKNTSGSEVVRAFVEVSASAVINDTASDLIVPGTTLLRRNQAQTHQVEVELNGSSTTHVITFGFDDGVDTPNPDSDADNLLDSWETSNFGNLNQNASGDPDGDGVGNLLEMKLGSNPNSSASTGLPTPSVSSLTSTGFTITFDTVSGLNYQVVGTENLAETSWPNIGSSIPGDGTQKWVTDPLTNAPSSKFYKVQISSP